MACVTSVADYGSPIWWKSQPSFIKLTQSLQNLGLGEILGAFKTNPIIPMELEAALMPAGTRLDKASRSYAIRQLKLQA